jgi:biotin carboxyl carrier protein
VIQTRCSEGQEVKIGDTLLVLESLKMEMLVKAPVAGTVTELPVYVGDQVHSGQILVVLKPA